MMLGWQGHDGTRPHGNATLMWEWMRGNISLVKDHPAIGAYYGCDDCCHMDVISALGMAEVKARTHQGHLLIVLSKTCNNVLLNDTVSNKLTGCLAGRRAPGRQQAAADAAAW